MPSVGIPSSKIAGSTCGASSAYTDAGPPLKMTAYGLRARTASGEIVCPTSSEYTRHSRTRRAISCEYCPPRSMTSTGRSSTAGNGTTFVGSAAIVRRLFRDRDVVRVRLAQPGRGDPHEPRALHLVDRRGAAVAHRLPQAADELVDDRPKGPLVRDAALDPLGDELVDVLDVALEVAVLREGACAHRAERAHAPVLLEALALDEDHVARRLFGSREERAQHHRVRTCSDRLRDVAGGRHAAVADERHVLAARDLRTVVDRRHLRHTDSRDDARRADRARTDADLDRVGAGIEERARRLTRRY